MTKQLFTLLFSVMASVSLFAQDNIIQIGEKFSVYSQTLQEDRPYWVYLPPTYSDVEYGKASYPVIYLLDGDTNFLTLAAIQRTLTRGMYYNMPECIIVAVLNTDRSRDLTPTRASVNRNGQELHTSSGGSEAFTAFLTAELRTTIEAMYRTNGYNVLIGHSFGGLFAINTLLEHPHTFDAYVALDPSLWWDDRVVYRKAEAKWGTANFEGKYLYVAMANNSDKPGDRLMHSTTIHRFCTELLPSSPENKLKSTWRYYEDEDHGSILMPGMLNAMRGIFKGIELPVKAIPEAPELIQTYYNDLSKQLGFTFIPDEVLIDRIGKYALSIGKVESAIAIFEYNLGNYPDSKNAKRSLEEAVKKRMCEE